MSEVRPFPGLPVSVARARHFAVAALGDASEETRDHVALLVSELATNCVRHARTGFQVSVRCADGRVQVEVTDQGGGRPTARSPEPEALSGRGLHIVGQLCEHWGVRPHRPPPGKTVWFTLPLGAAGLTVGPDT